MDVLLLMMMMMMMTKRARVEKLHIERSKEGSSNMTRMIDAHFPWKRGREAQLEREKCRDDQGRVGTEFGKLGIAFFLGQLTRRKHRQRRQWQLLFLLLELALTNKHGDGE